MKRYFISYRIDSSAVHTRDEIDLDTWKECINRDCSIIDTQDGVYYCGGTTPAGMPFGTIELPQPIKIVGWETP